MNTKSRQVFLLVMIVLMGAGYGLLVITKPLTPTLFFYVSVFTSLLFLICCYLLLKINDSKSLALLLLITGILFRVSLITVPPAASDDIYRYLWDGKVLANGINPYEYAPADTLLNGLHSDLIPAKVNFPEIKTIYPPFSQVVFFISYTIAGESTTGFSGVLLFFEIITILGLYFILIKMKLPRIYIGFYALSPLPVTQFMVEGHLDAIGISMVVLGWYFLLSKKHLPASLFFALSILAKFLGGLFLLLLLKGKSRNEKLLIGAATAAFVIIAYLPFFSDGTFPFESLLNYSSHWSFNGAFYSLAQLFIDNTMLIRGIALLLLVAGIIFFYLKENDDAVRATSVLLLLLLLSPTAYAWYVVWLAFLLPPGFRWSAALLTALVSVTNVVYIRYLSEGVWEEPLSMLLIQYVPVIGALILEYTGKLPLRYPRQSRGVT